MLLNCGINKTLESPLDCKEIKPINPKGNKSWIFIGRTDAEAEDPILLPPDVKSWLIGKDPDSGKDWKQEEKGTAEDEMVGWHHRLDGHEFEHAPGVGDGQGSLECCSPVAKSQTWLSNWTELWGLNQEFSTFYETEALDLGRGRTEFFSLGIPADLGERGEDTVWGVLAGSDIYQGETNPLWACGKYSLTLHWRFRMENWECTHGKNSFLEKLKRLMGVVRQCYTGYPVCT